MKKLLLIAGLSAAAAPAAAHIALHPGQAERDSYFVGSFRVGHGCDGAATTAVRIVIPDHIQSARPRPVPGWTLSTEKDGGKVVAVTWTGNLPDEQFQAFDILMHLPASGASLFFPATQTCGATVVEWNEMPAPGASSAGLEHPAPRLDLGNSANMPSLHDHGGGGEHDHSAMQHDHSAPAAAPAAGGHEH